jgi:hypothetical protein
MASLNTTFDATGVFPTESLEVLPPGKYLAHIIESEMQVTKGGDGQFLKLVIEVLEGQYARRKVFDRLNLVNNNQQAVEIAQRQLSAICHAVGQMQVTDSEQLHFKPLFVTLKVEPAGPDKHGMHREARNGIRGYSPAAAAPPSATQPPAAVATAPWRRSA